MSDTMRAEFEAKWPGIAAELPSHQRLGNGYTADDVEFAEKRAAWEGWQAAQSQPAEQWTPEELKDLAERGLQAYECKICGCSAGAKPKAPPVPATVQEIMRLMMPYIAACVNCSETIPDRIEQAEAVVNAAYKPLEAALTALVGDNHRMKFELDGVRAMRSQAWISVDESLPEDYVPVVVYTPPRNGENECINFEAREEGSWIEHNNHYEHFMIIGGRNAIPDCECTGPDADAPYTHWMPLPASPTHGIEPEQGEVK